MKSKFNKLFNLIMESTKIDFNKRLIFEDILNISDAEYESIRKKIINDFYKSLDTLSKKASFLFLMHKEEYRPWGLRDSEALLEFNLVLKELATLEHMSVDEIKKNLEINCLKTFKYTEDEVINLKSTGEFIKLLIRYLDGHVKYCEYNSQDPATYDSLDDNLRLQFYKFESKAMQKELSNRVTEKDICQNWGCQNAWGQKTSALFDIVNSKHAEMMEANPEAHEISEYHTQRGDHKVSCTCGFAYNWDSSD